MNITRTANAGVLLELDGIIVSLPGLAYRLA